MQQAVWLAGGAEWRTGGVLARNMMLGRHQEQRPVPLELRGRDISSSGGSELEMRARKVKVTVPRWATVAHVGPQVGPEARTSSEKWCGTSADIP